MTIAETALVPWATCREVGWILFGIGAATAAAALALVAVGWRALRT